MPEYRKKQMNSAIKLTFLFLALYGLVTQQVLANTWIRRVARGNDVDQPRNLAKSVTVE